MCEFIIPYHALVVAQFMNITTRNLHSFVQFLYWFQLTNNLLLIIGLWCLRNLSRPNNRTCLRALIRGSLGTTCFVTFLISKRINSASSCLWRKMWWCKRLVALICWFIWLEIIQYSLIWMEEETFIPPVWFFFFFYIFFFIYIYNFIYSIYTLENTKYCSISYNSPSSC